MNVNEDFQELRDVDFQELMQELRDWTDRMNTAERLKQFEGDLTR